MPAERIFITGATGYIGSHVADVALRAGYRVRLAVRKSEQIEKLKNIFAGFINQLEFVVISDITTATAFQGQLDEIDYVFHIASPMPGKGSDFKSDYLAPAVKGTESILFAAKESPTIKKVIIVSSVLSLMPLGSLRNPDLFVKEDSQFDLHVNIDMSFPDGRDGAGLKYQASKILAHQASLTFMKEQKPKFSLITLHPSFVIGPSLIQTSLQDMDSINARVWDSLHSEQPAIPSICIDVRDVAEAHLKALELQSNSAVTEILLSGPRFEWTDVVAFVKEKYPALQMKLVPPFSSPFKMDVSRAEELLHIKWRSMQDMVGGVIDQQIAFQNTNTHTH